MAKRCAVCGDKIGLMQTKVQLLDGICCMNCWTQAGFHDAKYAMQTSKLHTVSELISIFEYKKELDSQISSFRPTNVIKHFNGSVQFDDNSKTILVIDTTTNPSTKFLFRYNQIESYYPRHNGQMTGDLIEKDYIEIILKECPKKTVNVNLYGFSGFMESFKGNMEGTVDDYWHVISNELGRARQTAWEDERERKRVGREAKYKRECEEQDIIRILKQEERTKEKNESWKPTKLRGVSARVRIIETEGDKQREYITTIEIAEQIRKLKELEEAGVLTEKEFRVKKNKLLGL